MQRRSLIWIPAVLAGVSLLLAACGGGKFPSKPIEFIAPGGAGGGWDTTARTAAKALNDEKIVTQPITVVNKSGGGGAVGLAYLAEQKASGYYISVYSPPLLLIALNGQSQLSYKDTTPIAQVMTDYAGFVVRADSPYQTIQDLMAAAKQDPTSVTLGGGSAPGSMDHLSFVHAAKVAGVDIKALPYVSFQAGGEAMTALLGGHVDVISTGAGEAVEQARAGKVRVLAVTSPRRIDVLADVPTLKEAGIDAEFIIWRGFFGPPGMPEEARKYFEDAFKRMVESKTWKDAAAQYGWTTEYKNSADFKAFLDAENQSMEALLTELGLAKK